MGARAKYTAREDGLKGKEKADRTCGPPSSVAGVSAAYLVLAALISMARGAISLDTVDMIRSLSISATMAG